jgi:flavin reductase (DIM6/NTAB) family NADH-FMN oxidoreductase RutF
MTLQVVCCEGETVDSLRLRQALGRFATGVAVVGTRTPEGKLEGLTANSFAAVSLDPPLVLWSLRRSAPSYDSFKRSGFFSVSILSANQHAVARHFATRNSDKFLSTAFSLGRGGCPLIDDCLATFECQAQSTADGGDHLIFIGRVLEAKYGEGEPLIFNAGQYCTRAALADAG